MANLSQIEILVSELERLFVSLNEGLRTGIAEDGLTEVKVAKALLADSAKLLLSQDGTSSKNLDQITSDIKSFIEAIEVDPDNANKHTKISAYLEGKFFRKVVDAAYAKAVGDAEDTDTIINTFKELQEVIGAQDKTGNTGLTSILNRIAELNAALENIQNELETAEARIQGYVDGKISDVTADYKAADSSLGVRIDAVNADLVSLTNSTNSRFTTNEGLIAGLRLDLTEEARVRESNDTGLQSQITVNLDEFKAYELMLGGASKVIPAVGRLSNLKVSSLWKTTL
jgi:hypothetical protein